MISNGSPRRGAAPATKRWEPVRIGSGSAAAAIDAVVVILFAALGRSQHDEGLDVAGIAGTAWPFLVALSLAWFVLRAWRTPSRVWPTGIAIWILTWAAGMGLRALSGGGTALAFVLVALGVLGLGLVGWRAVARLTRQRAPKRYGAQAP